VASCLVQGGENRVLREMFEPKGEEVTGGWRKLYN
jgi:hypothetical protein